MNFLLDQDVYAGTSHFLKGLGHDVIPVAQLGLSQSQDEELLKTAQAQNRIFVTRDRDFGHLVFVKGLGAGVLYLRMLPSTQTAVHNELKRVIETYGAKDLANSFVVIESDGHRIRRFASK
jgi:predicted nuclease of predicted toxin-antitoxin system